MSELILTAFVYLTMITMTVALFCVGIALVQLIEDTPTVRRWIWNLKSRGFIKA